MRKYVYGDRIDEPICMINISGQNETKYYYHFDGLGSVVALSNSSGNVVESYSYDVFGTPSGTSSVGNTYLFTGRQYDSETGNYYYRARHYKPSIGRFLQTDPIGYSDSLNLYQYCLNNPVNWVDPWGLAAVLITINRDNRGGNKATTGTFVVTRDGKQVASGDTLEPRRGNYSIGKDKNGKPLPQKNYPIPAGNYDAAKGNFEGKYPDVELKNVPGFKNIEIHRGNSVADTQGCILVGKRSEKDCSRLKGGSSKPALDSIMNNIEAGDDITVTIND